MLSRESVGGLLVCTPMGLAAHGDVHREQPRVVDLRSAGAFVRVAGADIATDLGVTVLNSSAEGPRP